MAERNLVELLEETGLKELFVKRLKAKLYKRSWSSLAKYKTVFGNALDDLIELPGLPEYNLQEAKDYVIRDLRTMGELNYEVLKVDEFIDKFFYEEVVEEEEVTKTIIISGNFRQEFDGNLSKTQALNFLESIGLTPGVDIEINDWVEGNVKYLKCLKKLGTKGLV